MRVAVIGGGVIGLSCAWYLRRGGADVVVLERDQAGQAASRGNTGWVTPVFSAPLPAPGVIRQALRWTLSRTGPFAIRPRIDGEFARWCWRFARSTRRRRHESGLKTLVALNESTMTLFDGLVADGVEFEMHRDGVLLLFRSVQARDEELEALEDVSRAGYEGPVIPLTGDDARSFEPALGDGVQGAIHLPAERHVRPELLVGGLTHALRRRGVEVRERNEVVALGPSGRGWRLRTSGDDVAADRVVVATGAWARTLLRRLGVRIRLQPAKGYTATLAREGVLPRVPLYLSEARVSCSPFDGCVRLAGMLELGASGLDVDRRRVDAIVGAPARYLREWTARAHDAWVGLRPLSADGLPFIGPVPRHEGVFLATGHGMLGITLAPATGHALAGLMLHGRRLGALDAMEVGR